MATRSSFIENLWYTLQRSVHVTAKDALPNGEVHAHGRTWIVVRYLSAGVYLAVDAEAPLPAELHLIKTDRKAGHS